MEEKHVLIRHYAQGAEMTVCNPRKWKYNERIADSRPGQESSTIDAAISRARSMVLRKSLAINADRLLTLTMPGDECFNIQPLDEAWKMHRNFLQRLRRANIRFDYVSVPEKQNRGAWHFHLAINQYVPIRIVDYHWKKVGGGNADIDKRKITKHFNKPENIARYIAKYIGKEMDGADFLRNRYRTSTGIVIDIERLSVPKKFFANKLSIRETFKSVTGMNAGTLNFYERVITVFSWGDEVNDFRGVFYDSPT